MKNFVLKSIPEIANNSITEKDRRVYYQNIVYSVCNSIDLLGGVTVCGTAENPSKSTQYRTMELVMEIRRLRSKLETIDDYDD